MTAAEANAHPEQLPFNLAPSEHGHSADDLWQAAIADLKQMVEHEGQAAWPEIVKRYDEYSLYEFLRHRGFSEGAIEFYAVMNFVESDLHNSFIETLREELGGFYVDMQTIVGGMDLLPQAFYREVQDEVRFGTEVRAIEQNGDEVKLHCRVGPDRVTFRGDYAICTVPFSVLRPIEADFSHDKERAIRQLNLPRVDQDPVPGPRAVLGEGGRHRRRGVGDRPADPAHQLPTADDSTSRGVLLASYTWGQDALQWGAMDEEMRIDEALDDVEQIHPRIRHEFEVGASHAWYSDRWARGAFALFAPEQQTTLQSAILKPEGRVYFAGEHCSLYHAWIQGALESGIRAAREIHELPAPSA